MEQLFGKWRKLENIESDDMKRKRRRDYINSEASMNCVKHLVLNLEYF